MRRFLTILILFCLLGPWIGFVWSHNPFTSEPKTHHQAPEPPVKSAFFVKIILWQHQLRQKMSELIRQARTRENMKPLLLLLGLAFAYGSIHAAGPGHGKFVAVSYVMSHKTSILNGLVFGLFIGVIHGFSGVVGVLGLRYIIQKGVGDTLAAVTTATQMISFGLIILLGTWIVLKNGRALFFPMPRETENVPPQPFQKGLLPWAVSVGVVPCPAVVMVMLFCMTMDAMILGLFLAACISLGMAATISLVVTLVILGKTGVLRTVPEKGAGILEISVGLLSGTMIMIFGAVFFYSTLISVYY